MFSSTKEELSNRVSLYKLYKDEVQLTYRQVIRFLQNDATFRDFYNKLLAESSFKAFFWENPPITISTIEQAYEFVLVNSDTLSQVVADKNTFNTYFTKNKNGVVYFENLRKDALLVVPTPVNKALYPHIATFVRKVRSEQLHTFWEEVGQQIEKRISGQKLWVSTSGLGVYWLHIRLDNRPKYYTFRPYKLR